LKPRCTTNTACPRAASATRCAADQAYQGQKGDTHTITITHAPQTVYFPAQYDVPVTITGIHDGGGGITLGFISYTLVKLICGRWRELNIGVIVLAAILLARLIWVHG